MNNNKHKLKITLFEAPYTIEDDGQGNTSIKVSFNTDLYQEVSFEEFEIDADKDNLQLKMKEYIDKVAQFNKRQEFYIKEHTGSNPIPSIKVKIIQRQKA